MAPRMMSWRPKAWIRNPLDHQTPARLVPSVGLQVPGWLGAQRERRGRHCGWELHLPNVGVGFVCSFIILRARQLDPSKFNSLPGQKHQEQT